MLHLLLSTALAAPVDAQVDAASDVLVDIELVCGSVRITGWGKDKVHVTGDAPSDSFRLSGGAGRIGIEASDYRNNRCADLLIRVPGTASVRTETRSADVAIENITGRIDHESISGRLDVAGAAKGVTVEVISGDVRLKGPIGTVDAETVSGDLSLEGLTGRAVLETVSGDITLRGGTVTRLDTENVSGDLTLAAGWSKDARIQVSNHSGRVDLTLPSGAHGHFRFTTHSGSISGELGGPVERPEYGPGASCEFTLAKSDATLEIATFSGNIRVSRSTP